MAYKRKTRDRWDIETRTSSHNWEAESSYDSYAEAKVDIKGYREYIGAYGGVARIVKRREPIDKEA